MKLIIETTRGFKNGYKDVLRIEEEADRLTLYFYNQNNVTESYLREEIKNITFLEF